MTPLTLLRHPATRERRPADSPRPRSRPVGRARTVSTLPPALPLFDDAPAARAPERTAPARVADLPATGDGPTLDDLVVGAWEGLLAHETVPCPACGGALAPRYGSGPGPVGGRCSGCGTTVS